MKSIRGTSISIGISKRVNGYAKKNRKKFKTKSQLILEAIIISTLLTAEPSFINQPYEPDTKLERKRSHKRRRKIRKPVKGLR